MANSRERQARQEKSERRKDKRALRRSISSSEENEADAQESSSLAPRQNGGTRNANGPIGQASTKQLEDMTLKLISLHETFLEMDQVVGILKYMKASATKAADVFRPEIELKTENERLRKTLDHIIRAVRNQELEDMKERCLKLESEQEELASFRQEAEQARELLEEEEKSIRARREALEKEFEDKSKAAKAELHKNVANKMKATQESLALSQKSEEKLKQSCAKLSKDKEEVEQKFGDLRFGHDRLLADFRKLKSELDLEKSRFSIPNYGVVHYRKIFQKLQQMLEDLVFDFITGPTHSDQIEVVENERLEEQQFFKYVPTRNSLVAQYLWKRGAQAMITSQLSSRLWQTFPCDGITEFGKDSSKLKTFLNIMSQKFAEVNPEGEGIWRNLTYKILHELSPQPAEDKKQREDIVSSIVKALDPIIDYNKKDAFALALTDIVSEASDIWLDVKKDSNRICILNSPPNKASDTQQWVAASLKGIGDVDHPKDIVAEGAGSLCLFPSITMLVDSGKNEIILPGQVLFADCEAFAMGFHEQQESARELEQQQKELRHNFRKNSISSQSALSPKSPTFRLGSPN